MRTKQKIVGRHNRAAQDIMHILRGGFDVEGCVAEDAGKGRIVLKKVCKYHLSRCNCTIRSIQDGGGAPAVPLQTAQNQSACNLTPDINKLFRKMEGNFQVAGGWYLVQQQREWLQGRIERIMQAKKDAKLRILVAGIAGYAHFFSYMKILFDAAQKVSFPIGNLQVDVVDKCLAPLLEIGCFYDMVKQKKRLIPLFTDFGPMRIHFNLRNLWFIYRMRQQLQQCRIKTFMASLLENPGPDVYRHYDVVTEHFLTSMMEKNLDAIVKFRNYYQEVMADGGHLLVASGFPNIGFYEQFKNIHEVAGFNVVSGSEMKVWDPFGLSRQTIHLLRNLPHQFAENAYVPLDNIMVDFVRNKQDRKSSATKKKGKQ